MTSPQNNGLKISISSSEDIERLFLRLVVADTDAKLQRFTTNNLCDLINAIDDKPEFKLKIHELLTHYNKMVKNNMAIDFPVDELLSIFTGDKILPSNLALIYLKYAKQRLNPQKQLEIMPLYLNSIDRNGKDIDYRFELLSLSYPGLEQLSTLENKDWPKFEISENNKTQLTQLFLDTMTFKARDYNEIALKLEKISKNQPIVCEGLSPEKYKAIGSKLLDKSFKLAEQKMIIMKLLAKGLIDDKTAFPILVQAAAANINVVDDAAESALRKIDIQKIVDSPDVVNILNQSYLGSAALTKPPTSAFVTVQSGDVLVKQKVLQYLSRSTIAPTIYMNNVKIALDGISNEVPKVQISALIYFDKIINLMPAAALKLLGDKIFMRLRKMVRPANTNSTTLSLVYRCLGTFGKKDCSLVFKDISIVDELLKTIAIEEEDVAYSIVDCLVAWLPAFCQSKSDQSTSEKLKKYISDHVTHENAKCRMVSLKYIESLIDENEMDLKWMLLRASGDSREEMRQEAIRLLELSLKRSVPTVQLVVSTFWNYLRNDIESGSGEEKQTNSKDYNGLIHQMCSRYLWAVCETIVTKKPAELRIVEGDDYWITVAPLIVKMITETNNIEIITMATKMTLFAIRESTDVHQYRIATCFLTCLQNSPIASESDKNTSKRFGMAISTCAMKARDSTRLELSQTIAFLLSMLISDNVEMRKSSYTTAKDEIINKRIPGLCWTLAAYVTPSGPNESLEKNTTPLALEIVGTFLKFAVDGYERPSSMLEASLGAIGFILQNFQEATLAIPAELKNSLIEICEKIAASRKDSLSQRCREAASRVIGWLVVDTCQENFEKSIESLYRIGEGPPQPELQLTVGEAILDAILGKYSSSRRDYYLKSEEEMHLKSVVKDLNELETLQSRITVFLTQLIDEKLTSGNHHLRRAALVWLLVVVQRMSKLGASAFSDRTVLSIVQNAFADGLAENDEFTQDIASKGMGVVYGVADGELKKELVSNLMGALTEGRRTERKVDGSTVLFERGQLGKTPTGDNLTTYKELCSLATDLNQPDLVYKFMQLAKHNATWNAKKGAAFGFGVVLEQAKDELEPYFGSLVPKLFRYRYDPDLKVQASMRSIWTVLTSNRRNVVDEFANEIAKELEPALVHKEWRVRESACLALSDLLRGHDTEQMHRDVPRYLETVLRVRDDIKESVRLAADKTAESIRRLVVRLASSTNSAKADAFLSKVLPTIVDQGIVNATVKANKIFCLALVLEMTKTAGRQLKPYLDKLIPTLLDSISDNESAILNYIAVRSDSAQLEALDDARASMARTSPMMTAINDLLPHIDSSVLIAVTPKLCDQLRASIGMSTRSATAQLITQLALRAPQLMMDHKQQCDKLFHSLIPGVRDRNPSIRKQFANAMSYLAKFVSPNLMINLVKTVVRDLVTENEEMKQSALHVLRNLAANCSELLAGYATQIVPYVFLETCRNVPKGDEAARLKHEEWSELWAELVPSTSAAARLYKDEIIGVGLEIVTNNEVWTVRAQTARMIAKTAEVLKEQLGNEAVGRIVDGLLPTLSGRIWTGKEEILNALAKTLEAGGEGYKKGTNEEKLGEISKVLKREASKRNVDYSSIGLAALARYCAAMKDEQTAEWLAEKVAENIEKVTKGDGELMSDDEEMSNLEKEIRASKIVTANLTALAAGLVAFGSATNAQKTLEQLIEHLKNPAIAWKSKQNMFVELGETVQKWDPETSVDVTTLVLAIFEQADVLVEQQKKTVAADALQIIIRMQERRNKFKVDWDMVAEKMKNGTAGLATGLSNRISAEAMEVD